MIHKYLQWFIDRYQHFMEGKNPATTTIDRVLIWYWGKVDHWAKPWRTIAIWMPEIVLVLLSIIFMAGILALCAAVLTKEGVPWILSFGMLAMVGIGVAVCMFFLEHLYQKQRKARRICTRCGSFGELYCPHCEVHYCPRCFEQTHIHTPEQLLQFRQSLNEVIRQSEESE